MRLLNVQDMRLEEYFGSQIPRYAILSHCWGAQEVTFQDINGPSWRELFGAWKVLSACQLADRAEFKYIWIDTCCIDKTSSAELSEAINSMYAWYENAVVCYAYLEDVEIHMSEGGMSFDVGHSRWFTRGWTLQELIAPKSVDFYDTNWLFLGNKTSLLARLSEITRISQEALMDPSRRDELSVARKMSWAGRRQTTRIEDTAYCLLGIFKVNMPLLYGEGTRAFVRLQEEILKETDDHSLFAWEAPSRPYSMLQSNDFLSVLAESPTDFMHTANAVPYPSSPSSQPCAMTSRGLRIDVLLYDETTAVIESHWEHDFTNSIAIPVKPLSNTNVYARAPSSDLITVDPRAKLSMTRTTIFLVKNPVRVTPKRIYHVELEGNDAYTYSIAHISPRNCIWDNIRRTLQVTPQQQLPSGGVAFAFHSRRLNRGFMIRHDFASGPELYVDRKRLPNPRILAKLRGQKIEDWLKHCHDLDQSNLHYNSLVGWRRILHGDMWFMVSVFVRSETVLNQEHTFLRVVMTMEKLLPSEYGFNMPSTEEM
ncbi:hypothetical protein IFR05_000481 [Cadophora sp. M221]|nr:hypothetical protein IFR05_000481 [Cadophora sp. M221]